MPIERSRRAAEAVPAELSAEIAARNELDLELHRLARVRLAQLTAARGLNADGDPEAASTVYYDHMRRQPAILAYHWSAMSSPVGRGWFDVQGLGTSGVPPHRWSMLESSIDIPLLPQHRYRIELSVLRFVHPDQESGLLLKVNDGATGPLRLLRREHEALVYAGEFGPSQPHSLTERLRLTFIVERKASFADVNPSDPDHRPRGFALATLDVHKSESR